MQILLDTHVLLWWLGDMQALSSKTRAVLAEPTHLVYASAASAWEIAIKKALGKLDAPDELGDAIADSGFLELPVTLNHAMAAGQLPEHHSDPFDRMLVAQAQLESLMLVTRDARLRRYDVPILDA